jgi:hypothetical protein
LSNRARASSAFSLLAHLHVPLHTERPFEGEAGALPIGAQAEDAAGGEQLSAAVQDPVVLEGGRPHALRLQLRQASPQVVELDPRELDLAF